MHATNKQHTRIALVLEKLISRIFNLINCAIKFSKNMLYPEITKFYSKILITRFDTKFHTNFFREKSCLQNHLLGCF